MQLFAISLLLNFGIDLGWIGQVEEGGCMKLAPPKFNNDFAVPCVNLLNIDIDVEEICKKGGLITSWLVR